MKRLLAALACTLVLTGCTTEPEVKEFDVTAYITQLETTDYANVKVKLVTGIAEIGDIEKYLTEEDAEFRTGVIETLKGLTLTKAESQDKIYGTPVLYIDLNNAASTDYARFSVYETAETVTVVILTNEGYTNYTADATEIETLKSSVFNYYTAE